MKRTVPGVVARAGDVARRLGITRGLRQRLPRWGAESWSGRDASFVAGCSVPLYFETVCGVGASRCLFCAQSIEGDVSNRLSNLKLL